MARISFETAQSTISENTGNSVGFFSLKNNGDEAIVRILHDSVNDFDILTTHQINFGGKYRKVSCIRDPRDPIANCPFCAQGTPLQQRFFIHMIQYENVNGQITAKPVVWERSANEYGNKLKTMIEEYGPLSECIFKIKRNGAAGDMNTTYEILFCNPNVYRSDLYPKDTSSFDNYNALGTVVLDKNYNEITEYLATGSFPQSTSAESAPQVSSTNRTYDSSLDVVEDNNTPNAEASSRMPWESQTSNSPQRVSTTYSNTPPVNRPNRSY